MGLEKAGEKTIRMNKLRNGGFKEIFKKWKKSSFFFFFLAYLTF